VVSVDVVVFVVDVVVFVGAVGCEGEVEVELEEVDDELVDDGAAVVVVVELALELVEEAEAGAQDIDSPATTPLIGRFSDETGVPGGTLTLNVSVTPPTIVTVTVQASAEASGTSAVARNANTAAANASTVRSRRGILTVVRPLLPPSRCASHTPDSLHGVVRHATLLTHTKVCNFEPARPQHFFSGARTRAHTRVHHRRRYPVTGLWSVTTGSAQQAQSQVEGDGGHRESERGPSG
jgi:hypothetical protein